MSALYPLLGVPVTESPLLEHGRVIVFGDLGPGAPAQIVVGTAPADRAERLRRAARHEARLVCLALWRELGHDAPDPDDTWTHGRVPADGLAVKDWDTWHWPHLGYEITAWFADRERDRRAEQVRRENTAAYDREIAYGGDYLRTRQGRTR